MSGNNRVTVLLDRSASMRGSEEKMVQAVNGFIAQMQSDRLGKMASFELVTFDSQGFDPVRRGQMSDVKPLLPNEFVPRAATPLLDAVGSTISKIEGGGKNVFVIGTDGLENCSKKYSQEQIRALIDSKRKAGWVVIYLGANIDAWEQAENIGIPGEMAMNYKQSASSPPPQQQGQPNLFQRFGGRVARNPVGYAFGAAALIGLTYLALRPGDVHAAQSLGFTDADRNASMGVDGVSTSWREAVENDVASFVEPVPSDSLFDLPPDVAEMESDLPDDFDPALGSMVDGKQSVIGDGDILSPDDLLTSADFAPSTDALSTLGDSSGGGLVESISSGAEAVAGAVGNTAEAVVDIVGGAVEAVADVATSIFD